MPRTSKLRYWSNDAQAGESRTTGVRCVRRLGIARGGFDRLVERAGDFVRHMAVERRREIGGRLADQIGLADTREEFCERRDAAGLRQPAGDPENVVEASERARRRIRIGRFGIVDEQDRAAPPDLLHAVRKARK